MIIRTLFYLVIVVYTHYLVPSFCILTFWPLKAFCTFKNIPVLSLVDMGLPATHPLDLAKHAATQNVSSLGDVGPGVFPLEEPELADGIPGMERVCFTCKCQQIPMYAKRVDYFWGLKLLLFYLIRINPGFTFCFYREDVKVVFSLFVLKSFSYIPKY